MKTICAWCGKLISAACENCNAPLVPIELTAPHPPDGTLEGAMVCTNGPSGIVYTRAHLDLMESSHGICRECFAANTDKKRGPTDVRNPATLPAHPDGAPTPHIERDLDNEGQ